MSVPATAPAAHLRVPRPVLLALAGAALVMPPLLGGYPLYLATEALCWAIAAAALDLLVGYAGLTPLGHIAMWGLGGYVTALLTRAGVPLPLTLAVAAASAAVYSALTAPLALRAGGLGFLMLTLAFAQMLASLAAKWTAVTGGTDGLTFTPAVGGTPLYALSVAALALTLWTLTRVTRSPFGRVLEAIRQNAPRARALGYPVLAYQFGAVLIASAFIGLAGALGAVHRGIVTPSDVFWLQSAVLLIMVLLGGARSLWGPVLGAVLYTALQAVVSSRTDLWAGAVGALLIAVVLAGRGGLWSLMRRAP
ncbi:branched-chain amino acid transport system permease protein [Deinococcus metalli]|uniref:Branched-chain amino acid ABC transporter permease n=1 Tax=Deinococcus metalli TaxID=1141878 RepID=A0A7W8KEK4_9DEIO|nr:branched-chain amino acid ABC transporter permease [Deinococcus metalli]MBB5376500.1 branched-chain amino acid transport system permease protein [Deinococcus metalli]GHF43568.1 branched-chain amino acid ABC transporter permease [Deinococcus metalli]